MRFLAWEWIVNYSNCRGIQGELSAMVQGSPSFRDRLGPALLHTFSAVGVVEGLDVDKEDFDKYTARLVCTNTIILIACAS